MNESKAFMNGSGLAGYLSDLRMEIAGTERAAFREGLKKREYFLNDLLTRLEIKREVAP
jgi:hypothetical protein